MYLYCVYPAMLSPKQLTNCLENAFNGVLCEFRTYTVAVSFHSLYINQVPEKLY